MSSASSSSTIWSPQKRALLQCLARQYGRIDQWIVANPKATALLPAVAFHRLQQVTTADECDAIERDATFLAYDRGTVCKDNLCDPPF